MSDTVPAFIVDDEPVVQMTLAKLLESENYTVSTFTSAEDFRSHAALDTPYLLIVDKNLPGISGLDLVMQQREEGTAFEAILITGYADLDSAIDAVRLGFYSYIRKPFDFEKLLDDLSGARTRLIKRLSGHEPPLPVVPVLEELVEPVTSAEIHLNSVINALQDIKVSDATRENLEYAYARLQSVENLLEQKLTSERLQEGLEDLVREQVKLLEAMNSVIHEMSPLSSKVRIPLWLEAKAEIEILSHRALLRQLLKSLVTIALEFGEPGNPVVLDVEQGEEVAILHMVIMGNKAENPEGNEQNQFCRRLAQSINAELIIEPYLDDMGFEYTLRLPLR